MFDDYYSYHFLLTCLLITFGHFPDDDEPFPACYLNIHHRNSLLIITNPLPSHSDHVSILVYLLLGDSFVTALTCPSVERVESSASILQQSETKPARQPWCLRPFPIETKSVALNTTPDFTSKSSNFVKLCSFQNTPHSQTPKNSRRKGTRGPPSYANTGTSLELQFASPPSAFLPGGVDALKTLVFDLKDSDNEARFGCFIGKFAAQLHECGRARRHWKFVRSLCRSPHLVQHVADEHLTREQLEHILDVGNQTTRNDQVKAWRECFVHLYPAFRPFQTQLNPYVGQPLLNDVTDPRAPLDIQSDSDIMQSASNERTQPLFLRSPVPDISLHQQHALIEAQSDTAANNYTWPMRAETSRGVQGAAETRSLPAGRSNSSNAVPQRRFSERSSRPYGQRHPSFTTTPIRHSAALDAATSPNVGHAIDNRTLASSSPFTSSRNTGTGVPTGSAPSMTADTLTSNEDDMTSLLLLPTPSDITPTPSEGLIPSGPSVDEEVMYGPQSFYEFVEDLDNIPRDHERPALEYVNPHWVHYKAPSPGSTGQDRHQPREHAP